jgi:hypothetical protein
MFTTEEGPLIETAVGFLFIGTSEVQTEGIQKVFEDERTD